MDKSVCEHNALNQIDAAIEIHEFRRKLIALSKGETVSLDPRNYREDIIAEYGAERTISEYGIVDALSDDLREKGYIKWANLMRNKNHIIGSLPSEQRFEYGVKAIGEVANTLMTDALYDFCDCIKP